MPTPLFLRNCPECGQWLGWPCYWRVTWCPRCDTLVEAKRVQFGEPGSLKLDDPLGTHGEPVSNVIAMTTMMALGTSASAMTLSSDKDSYRWTLVVGKREYDLIPPPYHLAPAISQAFKAIANVDIYEDRIEEHGVIRVSVGDNEWDVDIIFRPTQYGEQIDLNLPQQRSARMEVPADIEDIIMAR